MPFSRFSEPAPSRDELMGRLKEHGKFTEEDIQCLKDSIVEKSYRFVTRVRGVEVDCPEPPFFWNGGHFGWNRALMSHILESIELHIKNKVPSDKQCEVWHHTFNWVPEYKKKPTPSWDCPPANPNADPLTAFSVSRAPKKKVKSNAKIVHDMVVAADKIDSEGFIGAQITWWDGTAASHRSCMFHMGENKVTGGRLGRDHTLEDVPNNYVRDRVMDYITNQINSEETRDAARRAVFTDLTDDEIKQYAEAVENDKLGRERKIQEEDDAWRKENDPFYNISAEDRKKVFRVVSPFDDVKRAQVDAIVKLARALDSVDDSIDLTPQEYCPRNNSTRYGPDNMSVLKPRQSWQLRCETMVGQSDAKMIDRDCDQVRALIKKFPAPGEWSLDDLRLSLPTAPKPTRAVMTSFLAGRGPCQVKEQRVFEACWEFFHRREQLGAPLVGDIYNDTEVVHKKWVGGLSDEEDSDADMQEQDKENEVPPPDRAETNDPKDKENEQPQSRRAKSKRLNGNEDDQPRAKRVKTKPLEDKENAVRRSTRLKAK